MGRFGNALADRAALPVELGVGPRSAREVRVEVREHPQAECARAGDLLLVGPPFSITNDQIDEAVSTLGDAIAAVTRA